MQFISSGHFVDGYTFGAPSELTSGTHFVAIPALNHTAARGMKI